MLPEGSDTKKREGGQKEGIPLTSLLISICDLIRGRDNFPRCLGGGHVGGWYLKGKADSAAE